MSSSSSLAALSSATRTRCAAAGPSALTAALARSRWDICGALSASENSGAAAAGSVAHEGALPGADGALAQPALDSGTCRAAEARPGSPAGAVWSAPAGEAWDCGAGLAPAPPGLASRAGTDVPSGTGTPSTRASTPMTSMRAWRTSSAWGPWRNRMSSGVGAMPTSRRRPS